MTWRVSVLTIAAPLTVAVGFSLAANDATVTLECANTATAQCPAGTSSGVLLVSGSVSPITRKTTTSTVTFKSIDDSFKEAMAFRKDSAPGYKRVTWNTAETLAFKGHERLPIRIWAICTDAAGTCPALTATRRTKLEQMVANANSALIRERAGIMLVAPADGTLISDESGTPALTALKAVQSCAAFKVQAVSLNKFADGALNIYFVHTVEIDGKPGKGFACSNFRDVTAVGAKWSWALILHEIGHMLALDDVWATRSDWGSDPAANFMRHISGSRKFFTEGQIFRMHLDQNSAINLLLRKHPSDGRDCESSNPVLPCPKLNVRVWDEP